MKKLIIIWNLISLRFHSLVSIFNNYFWYTIFRRNIPGLYNFRKSWAAFSNVNWKSTIRESASKTMILKQESVYSYCGKWWVASHNMKSLHRHAMTESSLEIKITYRKIPVWSSRSDLKYSILLELSLIFVSTSTKSGTSWSLTLKWSIEFWRVSFGILKLA